MNIKKTAYFSYTMLFCTLMVELSAQPFGYPYDPYYDSVNPSDSPYHQPEGYAPAEGFPQRTIPPTSTNKYNAPIRLKSQPYLRGSALDSQPTDRLDGQPLAIEGSPEQKIDSVLKFWFGYLESPDSFPVQKVPLWEGEASADQELKMRFIQDYQNAATGQYAAWRHTPKGRLGLIILLDLFPRHIYANQAKMFATDPAALGLAQEGIRDGEDLKLFPIERAFFYMPFQHSENADIQTLSVKLYQKLVAQSPPQIKPLMQEFLKLAAKHKETIDRFGRFPHRNEILRRESTPEELKYLTRESSLRY